MKKLNLKNKLLILLCIPVICAVLSCSIFTNKNISKNQQEVSANYVDSSIYIEELASQTSVLESTYSLNSYYPIFPENQTDSNLCWIYSSLKVLETSLMKQKNEFHNFSEIGTALLYYKYYTMQNYSSDSEFRVIDKASNFTQFNLIAKNQGLIYESVLSNDAYLDVTEKNFEMYSEALDTADVSIMENINPINFYEDETFLHFNREKKIEILKRYITTYGGIFAGIEKGTISNADSVYYSGVNTNTSNDGAVRTDHAICIVGWDDNKNCGTEGTGAFYVLNSWGVASNSFQYFYVPYSYANIYEDTYGYICEDAEEDAYIQVSTTAGGEDGFTKCFMNTNAYNPNNLFVYGEDVELVYNVSNNYNFDSIFVNVYKGKSNVTSDFTLEFDEVSRNVKVTLDANTNAGEGYYIEFYQDRTFLGREDFYIFTGTEVSYVDFRRPNSVDSSVAVDSSLFNNNLASGNFSQTYYIYDEKMYNYYLDFYLPGLNKNYSYSKVDVDVSNIYITSTDGNGIITRRIATSDDDITVTIEPNQSTIFNRVRVKIAELIRNNKGKMIDFDVEVLSNVTGKVSNYNIKIYVSSYKHAETRLANSVIYALDGGVNNNNNINRYPSFVDEPTARPITSFKLLEPTKNNSKFMGWYLDEEFTIPVSEINSKLPELLGVENVEDITIYARWEELDLDFFDGEINITDIVDYNGSSKNLTDSIIYGDSVTSLFEFKPELTNLKNYKYFANYTYWFNGTLTDSLDLNPTGESITIKNNFLNANNVPELVCGSYTIKVNVFMVVSHQFSVSKDYYLSYAVEKKEITATFDENTLEYVYDGVNHKPTLVSLNGIYAEDGKVDFTLDRGYEKNYGEYEYNLVSVNNKNYKIAPNQKCKMIIDKAEITIEWTNVSTTYNGKVQEPTPKINGIIGDDIINAFYGSSDDISVVPELKNAGVYNLTLKSVNNNNYRVVGNTNFVFTIEKAKLTIKINNVDARFTLAPLNRPKITWTIEGTLYDDESLLNFSCDSKGIKALESGEYPITGTYDNSNYDVTIVNGVYKVLGFYYVYYTLPDNTVYKETVEDGETPKGVPAEVLKVPLFHKIEYSQDLVGNGSTDVYIDVTMTNYTWIIILVGTILGFFILYRLSTRRARRNRMR